MMCWILPGTSMDLNFAGRSGALWGMCKSPRAKTSTILNDQKLKARLGVLQKQAVQSIKPSRFFTFLWYFIDSIQISNAHQAPQ